MTKPVNRPHKRRGPKPAPPEVRLAKGRGHGRDSGGRLVHPVAPAPVTNGQDEDPTLYDDYYLNDGGGVRWDRAHLLAPYLWPSDADWTPPPSWRPQPGQPDPLGWALVPDGW